MNKAFSKEQKEAWIKRAEPPRSKKTRSMASIAILFLRGCSGQSAVTKCHFCHRTVQLSQIAICYKHCRTPFCAMCLWHSFNQSFLDTMRNRYWECPHCTRTCTCPECTSRSQSYGQYQQGGYTRPRPDDLLMDSDQIRSAHRLGRRVASTHRKHSRSRSRGRSRSRSRSRSRGRHSSHHRPSYPSEGMPPMHQEPAPRSYGSGSRPPLQPPPPPPSQQQPYMH